MPTHFLHPNVSGFQLIVARRLILEEQIGSRLTTIRQAAIRMGLTIIPVIPHLPMLGKGAPTVLCPLVECTGDDCEEFLAMAQQAAVTIIYAESRKFCLNSIYREALEELLGEQVEEEELVEEYPWFAQRLEERVGHFRARTGEVDRIACMWFAGSVAHRLIITAPWSDECCDTINSILKEMLETQAVERTVWSEQEAVRLKKLADQLARHERFPEASSEGKRRHMAEQLFPTEVGQHKHLAELAALIYWWDVEPQERVTKADRALALYRSGESIKNVAAILKLPESKVRAAIKQG